MPLLNFTTKVDADRTAGEITKCLSLHGAQAVMTEYDEQSKLTKSISFRIIIKGNPINFRLPCDWRPILEILKNDSKVRVKFKTQEQAVRTAWRIVKDWVFAQMALVETQMAKTEEVFLPYAVTRDGKTLAEKIINDPKFLLGDGK